MPERPRIAIPSPTSIDPEYNRRWWSNYAEAVAGAGGEAVAVDPLAAPGALRSLFDACDGFVLPGSPADVDPGRYGAERDEACGPADAAREQTDWMVLDHAERARKPVFGICYGLQSMNVWAGGTMVQDLLPLPVNHAAGSSVAVAHSLLIAKDSLLGALVAPAEDCAVEGEFLRLPVNSSHHQAAAQPGEGMRMTARCPEDGVLEAIELPWSGPGDWWLLGVQWHPERTVGISAASRSLFAAFVAEAGRGAGVRPSPAGVGARG